MKILQIHNKYKYFGGEDSVVDEEAKLLRLNNHEVVQLIRDNSKELSSLKNKFYALKNVSYSKDSIKILDAEILKHGVPDIVHAHNIFPLWSNSVFDFFYKKNIPIIMTLHNYRLIWEKLGLFNKHRDKYGFFKDSNIKSFVISKLINKRSDLLTTITKFITLTEFTKQEFSQHNIPYDKLIIKPNFLSSTDNKIKSIVKKKNAIYASRISKEKGILTLIEAFKELDIELDILGDGPLLKVIKKNNTNYKIKFYGNLPRDEVSKFLNNSKFLIIPSEWYECFPMSILEAFREGTLVLASNIGSIKSIIKDKYNGILFEYGNKKDLTNKINWILANPDICDRITLNANNDFKKKYSAEVNYAQLIKIYNNAIYENKKS
ncbi:glycosyltransferase family 4 protein [Candidatus Pelagibacter sp.]|jgi:glycosyltransferase involved in cell wall biosynthesis|nr:glycosyltransferase family 4 protein [Candidatus Pelagibacter sp.]|tara:strand:- start:665 stop:1795 length:1131 start_codon:yes stop_codon:yes gene_type:complete